MATIKMRTPTGLFGEVSCTGWRQSGATYKNITGGAILVVDERNNETFLRLGCTYAQPAPTGQ
jgi:hypothetical protein